MNNAQRDLAQLIIDGLHLEDVTSDDLNPEAPLFGAGGLGLDSIDALELAVLVDRTYGVKITAGDEGRRAFASLAALATFISERVPA